MDKSSCQQSSRDSSTSTCSTTSSGRDQYLKHLNKLSHKISKPTTTFIKNPPPLNYQPQDVRHNQNHSQPQLQSSSSSSSSQLQAQPQQNQPPVYNINKNDFRDVVQKLTGSPAHDRFSNPRPPLVQPPKPQSSRLQRFRPPPLAEVSNRPPPLLNNTILPIHQQFPPPANPNIPIPTAVTNFGPVGGRHVAPLSPLPPLPTVHAAAESPVSAYVRYLHAISTVDSNPKQFSGFSPLSPTVSPRWNNLAPTQPHIPPPQEQLAMNPPPQSSSTTTSQPHFAIPSSPLPFGCLNSPRSPYPWLSPGVLFSPSSGQLGFPQLPPLSPSVPVPSPSWRGL